MRPRLADWMTPVDRDILELLRNGDGIRELVLTPRVISANTDWSRDSVREHLIVLRREEMIEYYDESAALYQLTDKGRGYLEKEIPVEDLEDNEE